MGLHPQRIHRHFPSIAPVIPLVIHSTFIPYHLRACSISLADRRPDHAFALELLWLFSRPMDRYGFKSFGRQYCLEQPP